jgi:hypothetical protein
MPAALSQNIARFGFTRKPRGIIGQQESLTLQTFRRRLDCRHITRVIAVTFFQRKTRIGHCKALSLCLRERNESAGKSAHTPFVKTAAREVPAEVCAERRLVHRTLRAESLRGAHPAVARVAG